MSWDDLNEAHYNWPSIPEVRMYRDQVREFVDKLILSMPLSDKGLPGKAPGGLSSWVSNTSASIWKPHQS
jgi:hypothetical protein